jgi:hypothetical protein
MILKRIFGYGMLFVTTLMILSWTFIDDRQYPPDVENILVKAGENRHELEKALRYFQMKGDRQMLQAAYFLIRNMDIHYSETYVWQDKEGNKLDFSEFDYPNFVLAVDAIDSIRKERGGLEFRDTIIYDVESITGQFLIDNISQAFEVWQGSKWRDISFDDFCEYILPYRITVEPVQEWRRTYRERYQWMTDKLQKDSLQKVLIYAGLDFNTWFTSTWGKETRNEPLSRLGAQQLLFRKKGACEDIAALQVFSLRSQGIPASYNIITYWATSMGSHFVNNVFDENMESLRLDMTNQPIVNHELKREPAKVFRVTYSKNPETIAMQEAVENIPSGYLQMCNYVDVTSEWWETCDLTTSLFAGRKEKITYAYVFNYGDWKPAWWGKTNGDSVTFTDMAVDAVFLPAYYRNGWMVPAGFPVINKKEGAVCLKPDLQRTRSIEINQQDDYLKFRPGKRYELFYWDTDWVSVGIQTPSKESTRMVFKDVPSNALLILVPEYSAGKERPFIIDESGTRHWW